MTRAVNYTRNPGPIPPNFPFNWWKFYSPPRNFDWGRAHSSNLNRPCVPLYGPSLTDRTSPPRKRTMHVGNKLLKTHNSPPSSFPPHSFAFTVYIFFTSLKLAAPPSFFDSGVKFCVREVCGEFQSEHATFFGGNAEAEFIQVWNSTRWTQTIGVEAIYS